MTVRVFEQFTVALLAASIAAETFVLTRSSAGIEFAGFEKAFGAPADAGSWVDGANQWPDNVYFGMHSVLSLALIGALLALYRSHRAHPRARYTLWFAVGMAATTTGDIINSGISGVEPVSTKLTWAILLFGLGYLTYIAALAHYLRAQRAFPRPRAVFALVAGVLAVNVVSWFQYVEPNVTELDVLRIGTFIFNATIYVALPICGMLFYRSSGYATTGLFVLAGTLLLPFSDLILFDSWLAYGDSDVVSRGLYAANWIVYFGGQVLAAQFPAAVLANGDGATTG